MEQSVGQTANLNHAAELDQILASYKVCVNLSVRLCRVAWVSNMLCASFLVQVINLLIREGNNRRFLLNECGDLSI